MTLSHRILIRHLFETNGFVEIPSYRGNTDEITSLIGPSTLTRKVIHEPSVVWCYADWCGPCQKFAPIWKDFDASGMKKYAVNCDANKRFGEAFNIKGYPTILYNYGDKKFFEYTGPRAVESLKRAINRTPQLISPHDVNIQALEKILSGPV